MPPTRRRLYACVPERQWWRPLAVRLRMHRPRRTHARTTNDGRRLRARWSVGQSGRRRARRHAPASSERQTRAVRGAIQWLGVCRRIKRRTRQAALQALRERFVPRRGQAGKASAWRACPIERTGASEKQRCTRLETTRCTTSYAYTDVDAGSRHKCNLVARGLMMMRASSASGRRSHCLVVVALSLH